MAANRPADNSIRSVTMTPFGAPVVPEVNRMVRVLSPVWPSPDGGVLPDAVSVCSSSVRTGRLNPVSLMLSA